MYVPEVDDDWYGELAIVLDCFIYGRHHHEITRDDFLKFYDQSIVLG